MEFCTKRGKSRKREGREKLRKVLRSIKMFQFVSLADGNKDTYKKREGANRKRNHP